MGYVVAMETESPRPDCTRCKELEKQVAELAAEVKRLAKKLEFKTRESKRSAAPQRVRPASHRSDYHCGENGGENGDTAFFRGDSCIWNCRLI